MRTTLPLASALLAPTLFAQNVSHPPPPTPANAQTQFVQGLDIEGLIAFQGGFTGTQLLAETMVSVATTACNPGSVQGVWEASPDPDHPLITQLYARLHDGRFEQISDYGYGKHSFGSTNSGGCGVSCLGGAFNRLGIGCSDTYGAGLNWSRGDLGPLTEWNSFTGEWNFEGSHLDTGFPVTPPDNVETSISPVDSRQFRHRIPQSLIGTPGAKYYAMVYYLHKWEPEANRENNMTSLEINLTTVGATATGQRLYGSILQHYEGARVETARNEAGGVAMDGRFYVASHISENPDGSYHYEYAVHNRDHHAGNVQFTIPMCSGAEAWNFGSKDVDLNGIDPTNDWTGAQVGDDVVFSAPGTARPQGWNTIYNFWFDSNAAPGDGMVDIMGDLSRQNPGANPSVQVAADVPGLITNLDLGGGCGGPNRTLEAVGRATLPNPNFAIRASNIGFPGTQVALHINFNGAATPIPAPLNCSILRPAIALPGLSDGNNEAMWSLSIPNNPPLEGLSLFGQVAELDAVNGIAGFVTFSNKLRVRIGNDITGCQ